MVPGFLGGTPTEWATLLALVAGPGFVATLLWSPVLAAGRLRALFRSLPLTRSTPVNYLVVAMGLSVPWLVGLGWAMGQVGSAAGTPDGEPLLGVATQLAGLYVVALPVAAGAGLPELGIDWDPAGYRPSTWLLLVLASAWYAAVFAVPAFVFGVVISLPT